MKSNNGSGHAENNNKEKTDTQTIKSTPAQRLKKANAQAHNIIKPLEGKSYALLSKPTLEELDQLAERGIYLKGEGGFSRQGHYGKVVLAMDEEGHFAVAKKLKQHVELFEPEAKFHIKLRELMQEKKIKGLMVAIDSYQAKDKHGRDTIYQFFPQATLGNGEELINLLPLLPSEQQAIILQYVARKLVKTSAKCLENQLFHLDLKPDNILLDNNGKVYLSDFGSAVRLETTNDVTSEITASKEDSFAVTLLPPTILSEAKTKISHDTQQLTEVDSFKLGLTLAMLVSKKAYTKVEKLMALNGSIISQLSKVYLDLNKKRKEEREINTLITTYQQKSESVPTHLLQKKDELRNKIQSLLAESGKIKRYLKDSYPKDIKKYLESINTTLRQENVPTEIRNTIAGLIETDEQKQISALDIINDTEKMIPQVDKDKLKQAFIDLNNKAMERNQKSTEEKRNIRAITANDCLTILTKYLHTPIEEAQAAIIAKLIDQLKNPATHLLKFKKEINGMITTTHTNNDITDKDNFIRCLQKTINSINTYEARLARLTIVESREELDRKRNNKPPFLTEPKEVIQQQASPATNAHTNDYQPMQMDDEPVSAYEHRDSDIRQYVAADANASSYQGLTPQNEEVNAYHGLVEDAKQDQEALNFYRVIDDETKQNEFHPYYAMPNAHHAALYHTMPQEEIQYATLSTQQKTAEDAQLHTLIASSPLRAKHIEMIRSYIGQHSDDANLEKLNVAKRSLVILTNPSIDTADLLLELTNNLTDAQGIGHKHFDAIKRFFRQDISIVKVLKDIINDIKNETPANKADTTHAWVESACYQDPRQEEKKSQDKTTSNNFKKHNGVN